jgi:peroxiredoxin
MLHRMHAVPFTALLLLATACNSDDHDARTSTTSASEPAMAMPADKPADKPVETPLATAEVGQAAPEFALKDLSGKEHKLSQYKGKIVVLEWFSPACPTCKWAYETGPLVELPEKMEKNGVVWLSVNSEAGEHAAASIKDNQAFVDAHHMKAPVLLDPTGTVGRSYGAKSTPHMFVIDAKGKLVYKGGLDNAPGGHVTGGGERIDYVGDAVADVKAGRAVKTSDTRSYG